MSGGTHHTDGPTPPRARTALLAAAVVVTALVSATLAISPLNGEDFALSRLVGHVGIAERMSWALERSQLQIETWNARLGEQLTIFWLAMPPGVFQLVAVLTFLAFVVLVGTFALRRTSPAVAAGLTTVTVLAIWPLMELFFWRTVQAGYLQPLVLTLACLSLYRSDNAVRRLAASRWWFLPLSVGTFLVGLSFENVPIAAIPFMVAAIALARPQGGLWRTAVPVVALVAGWAVLLTAPSTALRNAYYRDTLDLPPLSVGYLVSHTGAAAYHFVISSLPLLLASAVAVVLLWRWGFNRRRLILILATVALVAVSVIPAPYVEERAFALGWALLLSLCVAALQEVWVRHLAGRPVVVAAACLLLLYFPIRAFSLYSDFANQMTTRDAAIRAAVGSPACTSGLEVGLVDTEYPRRYLNNREPWVAASLPQVSQYYGCTLVLK